MQDVLKHVHRRARELRDHPLFTQWLENGAIPARDKLAFAPMAIDFVMGFRDFNKYYIRYPEPESDLQRALNAHAAEDETHSALFLHDWVSLDLDERLGWEPRDLYWWMTCDETARARRADFELMKLAWENPDPLLRFAIVEAMEAAGQVFFQRTVPVVKALPAGEHPYFGEYHLHREDGHLQNADERLFLRHELSPEKRARARDLIDRVFRVFELHFDTWLEHARLVREERFSFRPAREGRAAASMRADRPRDASLFFQLEWPPSPSGAAEELCRLRRARFEEIWEAPAYRWVREAMPGEFRAMTRYFLLQWVVDNWACADYFQLDTTYPDPATPLERGINRASALFASEMKRRYVEWETLRFDDYTGFTLSQALRHYWLDPLVEQQREVFADLRKLTFRYPAPLHRYWILKCFARFGDTLMHSLGAAMRAAEEPAEGFITFAGEPERLHPELPADPEAEAALAELELAPLSAEDEAIVRAIIEETARQETRRAELTWQVIERGWYEPMHQRWAARPRRAMLRLKSRSVQSGGPS